MNLLFRTRVQLRLGLLALAPVAIVVLIFLTWPRVDGGVSPVGGYDPAYFNAPALTKLRALELLGTAALAAISIGVLLGDLRRRPMSRGLRRFWALFILCGAPFGGLTYWLAHCHAPAPDGPTEQS
jgi:4-amino-4-deoxy-L-arabinose transferase-like glycosyltransferase